MVLSDDDKFSLKFLDRNNNMVLGKCWLNFITGDTLVGGVMQERVYRGKICSVDHL